MHRYIFLLMPLILLPVADLAGARITETERNRALRGLGDRDLERRSEARVLIRLAGTNGTEAFRPALEASRAALLKCVPQLAARTKPAGKSFVSTAEAYGNWRQAVTSALVMVHMELHGDAGKLRDLNERLEDARRGRSRLLSVLRRGEFAEVAMTMKQLHDLYEDLSWLDGQPVRLDSGALVMPKDAAFDPAVEALLKSCVDVMSAEGLRVGVEAAHKRSPWARPEQRAFAEILNAQRSAVGLRPLLLGERLDEAALGHSEEMVKLGYFAHDSPVAKNKTPWDRARNAKFEGAAAGENIYFGSESPAEAFGSWLGSDGHRFIMYGDGVNALGVGRCGTHWTMMTGNFSAFPL